MVQRAFTFWLHCKTKDTTADGSGATLTEFVLHIKNGRQHFGNTDKLFLS